jgi:hypothetical protein
MALRAGYYGVKRFLRNKLETIAGTYDDTIKSLFPRSEQALLGAKNLAVNNAGNLTINGITYTKNSDYKIVATGTASGGNGNYKITVPVKAGKYRCSGCPSGGSSSTYRIAVNAGDSGSGTNKGFDTGNGLEVTIDTDTNIFLFLDVYNGYTANNLVFEPMIRLASDPDDTYVPYAMTNRELTNSAADQKTAINAIITAATGAADFAAFKTAMGAITPVTRSLSLTKEDITEEVKEDVEPEKTVTKKRTTKKTEEV